MSLFKLISQKIHGSIFAFFAVLIAIFSTIISAISLLSNNPEINLFSLWMSELSVSRFSVFFNISLIISSILLFIFIIYFVSFISKTSSTKIFVRFTIIFGFFSCLGLFLIGIFPIKYIGEVSIEHSIGAFIYWIGSFLFWTFLGVEEYINPEIPKSQAYMASLTACFWAVFLTFLTLIPIFPVLDLTKIPQWIVHFILAISWVEHGIFYARKINIKKRS
jgi:hypothetical protein